MSAARIAVTVATAAVAAARHPVVRAALQDPRTREKALEATRNAAYNAGRLARLLVGPKKS